MDAALAQQNQRHADGEKFANYVEMAKWITNWRKAHTMIKASDYGFGWAAKVGAPVGDDIEVTLLIEGVK